MNAFLITLAALLTWYLISTRPTEPEPIISGLTGIDPETIQMIRLSRPHREDIILQKNDRNWVLMSPLRTTANPFRINSILTILQTPALALPAASETDLEQLGLIPATVTLGLDQHWFTFGKVDPIGNGRYILYNNSAYIVQDQLYQQLLQDTGFFVSTGLFSDNSELVRIRYPEFEIQLRDQRWLLTSGDIQLTSDELQTLADAWIGLDASRVSMTTDNSTNADIMLETADSDRIELAITATTNALILTRLDNGLEYWFNDAIAASLGLALPQGD